MKLKELLERLEQDEAVIDQGEEKTLTIYDAVIGTHTIALISDELAVGVICPSSLDGCSEIAKKIEEGKAVVAMLVLWGNRVQRVIEIGELDPNEIDVDGLFEIRPSAYGIALAKDGSIILLKNTVNAMRLAEALQNGVYRVPAKLLGRHMANGRERALGVWFYADYAASDENRDGGGRGHSARRPIIDKI